MNEDSKQENQRINEDYIKNSKLIQINDLYDVCKSICRIKTSEAFGTGFFIKLEKKDEPFYCLMTCEHVITEDMINLNEKIEIYYNNQHEKIKLNLDKKERFIRCYRYLNIDSTVIQIIPKDNINEIYFLLPNLDYINGYEQFEKREIYIPQFPGIKGLSFSFGSIESNNLYCYEFSHSASTLPGSSGSPIFLKGSLLVLGIHKQARLNKKENYGNFIGPIVHSLKNDLYLFKTVRNNFIFEIEIDKINIENDIIKGFGKRLSKIDKSYYIGNILNFNLDGKGIMYNKNNKVIYDGDFAFNKYEGKGKLILEDGTYCIGKFINGKLHGKAIVYNRNKSIIYDGDFAFGKKEGKGRYNYDDGKYYIGPFSDNKRNGIGKIYRNKKIYYDGNFKNDLFEGRGRINYEDGKYYIGQFKEDLRHGEGTLYYKNGKEYYKGNFAFDKFEGKGTIYYEDNNYYTGNFINGLRHGKGIQYNLDNTIYYEGDFAFDKFEGNGRLNYRNGYYYKGEFINSNRHGKGKLFNYENNIVYDGEFLDDLYDGNGTYYYRDGMRYIGQFTEGKFNGYGILFNSDGSKKFEGMFINDKPDKCIIF